MKQIYTILLMLSLSFIYAQTQVSGTQSGTWNTAGSPYQVTGDITIPSGQVLNIEAGVEVNFQGHYKMEVAGQIIANGTDTDGIIFTATDHNTGWNGIRIAGSSAISEFHYCHFEYGIKSGSNYEDMNGGAIFINNADAQFYNCIFTDNEANGSNDDGMGGAVYAINTGGVNQSLTKFIDCKFEGNSTAAEGGAVKLTNDANSEFTRCEFINNNAGYGGGALMIYVGEGTTFTNCLFYLNSSNNSGGGAIKTLQTQSSLAFANCTFAYNSAFGYAEGGACDFSYADVVFVNSIIYGNSQQYGKDINVGMGASATINYCDLDMPDTATGNNNLDNVDPLFVNISQADFHLQGNSPCIDAGVDIGLPYNGNAPDLGCYEYGVSAVENIEETVFKLFPNPVVDQLYIQLHTMDSGHLYIENINGQIVLFETLNRTEAQIDLSKLSPGVYVVTIYTPEGVFSRKIIKK